jgi:copper chaperone CopZ
MKFNINIAIPFIVLLIGTNCTAQIKSAKSETVKIYGNCGMCEKIIETAGLQKGTAKVDWDQDTKMAQITFDSTKTNIAAVLQRIASAGYDNDQFTAPDEVYANLHGCCQYDRPTKTVATINPTATVTDEKPMAEVVVEPSGADAFKAQLGQVLNAYYAIKNALVADDSRSARSKAKALLTALSNVKMADLSKEQQEIYTSLAEKIKLDATKISETNDIVQQRDHFYTLSNPIFTVVKTFNVNTEPAYQQFCPMARDGKGANWLSKEKAIKNPYYGKSMLTCGKVTATLE